MKLVDQNTGYELKVGDTVTTFREQRRVLSAIWVPGTSQGGRGGRVQLEGEPGVYFPSVIGAKFIQ